MPFDISLVTLGVDDLDRSIAFYVELGLALRERSPDDDIAFFALDGAWLALYPRALLAADATVPDDGEGFRGVTLAHNVDSEVAVDELVERAIEVGAEPVKPPQRADWGGYSAYVADPDGHLWEVAHNPFLDLD